MSQVRLVLCLPVICLLSCVIAASAVQADEMFTVGMVVPLSGPAADYGVSIRQAVDMAQSDAPEKFTNIRFLYEDAMYDPKIAVSVFNRFRNIEKVNVIFTWGIGFCQALSPLAEQFKIPLVAQCIDEDVAKGRRYVIRLLNPKGSYIQPVLEHLREMGARKIAMVLAENSYLELMYHTLDAQRGNDFEFSSLDRYPVTQFDFSTTIAKLRASKPDAVAVFLGAGQISQFYRQLRQLHFSPKTIGTNFFESQSEIVSSQGAMDGAIFAFNRMEKDFQSRYLARFRKETQLGFGAVAYEFAMMVSKHFQDAPKTRGEEVLKRFAVIGPQKGQAAGEYRYIDDPEKGRYFEFPVVLKQIQAGAIVEVP